MALLGNYSLASKSPGRFFGGNSTSLASGIGQFSPQLPGNWGNTGARRNFALVEGATVALELAAIPSGYGGTGYLIPVQAGAVSAHSAAIGVATAAGAIAEGRNIAGTSAGVATVTGTAQLVVSGQGSAAGVATVSGNIVAALSGAGSAAGAATTSAAITALAWGVGTAAGVATTSAVRYATGKLAGSIAPAVTLEAAGFSTYLLDEEDVESGLTMRQALRLIAAATAGKVSGGGTTTITFRNAVDDSADRIIATVDSSGNRTALTYALE
jgi:hypothetical protein